MSFTLVRHANEYENPVRFYSNNLYTFIDGQERVITESDLRKLIGCEFYDGPSKLLSPYPIESVWDTSACEPGCKKTVVNLKSLPLRFLHHFIASTIQCRTGSFTKITTKDVGYSRWLQPGPRSILLGS